MSEELLGKKEAAERLGVSERSIERLVKEGHLTAQYVAGRTRPTPVYSLVELDALARSRPVTLRTAKPTEAMKKGTSESGRVIRLRLDDYYLHLLEGQAREAGIDSTTLAGRLLMELLDGESSSDKGARGDSAVAITKQLAAVREDIAVATEVLLIASGFESKEASRWVESNLRSTGDG